MNDGIVITGFGAICALGMDPDEIWNSIRNGRSGIRPITEWQSGPELPSRAAFIADWDPRRLVSDRKLHKLIRRTDLMGLYAAERAIAHADLAASRARLDAAGIEAFNDRTAVYDASGGGKYEDQYDFFALMSAARGELKEFGQELTSQVDPMFLLKSLPNNVLCHIGIRNGFKGPNGCIVNQSVSGALAIGQAIDTLRDGEADCAVVVAHDAPIEPQSNVFYSSLGLLSTTELRPFDARHDGTILGEGAAAMVLETRATARQRGARTHGQMLAVGSTSEAGGLLPVRADGDGLVRAIEITLARADVKPFDVGAIIAHGNGTPNSDDSEASAITRVFGATAPPITAFKWSIGHTLAGAGIIEALLALTSVARGELPGIATFERPSQTCAELPISREPQKPRSDIALVLCRGFGSQSTAMVLKAASRSTD